MTTAVCQHGVAGQHELIAALVSTSVSLVLSHFGTVALRAVMWPWMRTYALWHLDSLHMHGVCSVLRGCPQLGSLRQSNGLASVKQCIMARLANSSILLAMAHRVSCGQSKLNANTVPTCA